MFYQQFQRQSLLDLFKPTQGITGIGHKPLSDPNDINHNYNAVPHSYTWMKENFRHQL